MALVWLTVGAQLAALLVVPHLVDLLVMLQIEVHRDELVLDLFDGLRAKVADVEQVVLRILDQLTNRVDASALQAVVGANGKVQILNLLVELGVGLLALRSEDGRNYFALFVVLTTSSSDEECAHVLVDDVRQHGTQLR